MSKEVRWNKIILEEFIRLSSLSPDEEHILRMHTAEYSRVQIADKLGMSISSVDRAIKALKIKYDDVQIYSPLLPPRKKKK